jgi:glycosyltransferase involved in cell wall biosynthesis
MFNLKMPEYPVATSQVMIDISRLLRSRARLFATGVDRIDLAIALDLLSRFGNDCHFVHASRLGPALISRDVAQQLLVHLNLVWNEGQESVLSPSFQAGFLKDISIRRWSEKRARRLISRETTYVVASHSGLGKRSGALDRIDPHRLMTRSIYIHDIIPLEMPEYQRPGTAKEFLNYLRELTSVRITIVSNSLDTDRRIKDLAAQEGWDVQAYHVLQPTLSYHPDIGRPIRSHVSEYLLDPRPIFTIVGTIEPRKNHLLLLNLWRQMASQKLPLPRLCIIGKRGWENGNVFGMLDRCEVIRGSVTEFGDLSDLEVQKLITSSSALLFPSFTEGLGIPLLEAAAFGIHCIVSDIPVFREIAPTGTCFLDPLDGPGWRRAIMAAQQRSSAALQV